MTLQEISDDLFEELTSAPPKKTKFSKVCVCGWILEEGRCPNPECEWDAEPELVICPHCGSCEDPNTCVWGVQCPECFSPPHEHCLDDRGAKTGLHEARWNIAGRSWRTN